MKLETKHSVNKRSILNIKNHFLQIMKWVEKAQKGKTVCKS
jgi:hypothetical protein